MVRGQPVGIESKERIMATGEIQRLNSEIGIGFIHEPGNKQEILFHATALLEGTFDRLSLGQQVDFEHKAYANAPTKSRAIKVRPIGRAG